MDIELIKKHTELSEQTLKQYKSQINVLNKKLVTVKTGGSEILIRKYPELVLERLKEDYSAGTLKTYLNVIIVYIRSYIEELLDNHPIRLEKKNEYLYDTLKKYRSAWKEFQKDYEEKVKEGHMTEKQRAMFMTFDEYDEIIDQALMEDKFSQSTLILMLYRYAPVRSDYAILRLGEPNPMGNDFIEVDGNWYDDIKGEVILNDYKTKKTYGELRFKVDKMLEDYLAKYIEENDLNYGDYFFTKGLQEKPISKNTFSKRIPAVFKKYDRENSPTIQMLRHSYLMNKYGAIKEEMKSDAYMMGHSVETQKNYILKN